MARVLVAYFSRSKVAEKLAADLAVKLDADIDEVKPATGYAGAAGYLKAVWQRLRRRAPPVSFQRDPADYELVVIGSPVWAAGLSAPMRSYLGLARGKIGAVAAFWVSGSGVGYPGVGAEVAALTDLTPVATASFAQREVLAGAAGDKLEQFAEAIRAYVRQPA